MGVAHSFKSSFPGPVPVSQLLLLLDLDLDLDLGLYSGLPLGHLYVGVRVGLAWSLTPMTHSIAPTSKTITITITKNSTKNSTKTSTRTIIQSIKSTEWSERVMMCLCLFLSEEPLR